MNKLKIIISILVIVLMCNPIVCNAEETMPNDGYEKENPYGDSGLPSSFDSGEYYDCAIPYNVTIGEIGGYAIDIVASTPSYSNWQPLAEEKKAWYPGCYVNYYTDSCPTYGAEGYYEEETGAWTINYNGIEFYVSALQGFFFANDLAGTNGFAPSGENSSACNGQVVDIILTDGTCIHFICSDFNSNNHTNGGPPESVLWNIMFEFETMYLPQYKNLYAAVGTNTIELYGKPGSASKVQEKYNIGNGEGENRIAYYRMYNLNLNTSDFNAISEEAKSVSYNIGDIDDSSREGGHQSSSGSAIVSEWELAGMPKYGGIAEGQSNIDIVGRENLNTSELVTLEEIKADLELQEESISLDKARGFVVFIGLLLMVYSMLLLTAMVLDKVNTWIDISMVKTVSLGIINYAPNDIDKEDVSSKYITTKKLTFSIIIIFVVGGVLVSGGVFKVMGTVVYWFSQKFL